MHRMETPRNREYRKERVPLIYRFGRAFRKEDGTSHRFRSRGTPSITLSRPSIIYRGGPERGRSFGVSELDRGPRQGVQDGHRGPEGDPDHRSSRVPEDVVLLHPDVEVPPADRGVRAVHDPRGDRPEPPEEHGEPRGRPEPEHADLRLHGPPGDRPGRRARGPDGLPRVRREDAVPLQEGPRGPVPDFRARLPRRAVLPDGGRERDAEEDVLFLQDDPGLQPDLPRRHGAVDQRGGDAPRERGVPRGRDRPSRHGPVPREARAVPAGREDAGVRALHGEARDRGEERRPRRPRPDLRIERRIGGPPEGILAGTRVLTDGIILARTPGGRRHGRNSIDYGTAP